MSVTFPPRETKELTKDEIKQLAEFFMALYEMGCDLKVKKEEHLIDSLSCVRYSSHMDLLNAVNFRI